MKNHIVLSLRELLQNGYDENKIIDSFKGFKCPHNCEMYYYYDLVPNRKHHITYESMVEDYLPNGINKFKISGRNDNVINVIERYAEYFPRDEYRDQVRNHLLIDFFNNRPN